MGRNSIVRRFYYIFIAMKKTFLWTGIFILIIAGVFAAVTMTPLGTYMFNTEPEEGTQATIEKEIITFSKIGVVVENNPGLQPGVPYIVYEEPGSPGLYQSLSFDARSICVTVSGASPCIVMEDRIDATFSGNRVLLQGITQGENVLVRKLQLLTEGQSAVAPQPGNIFISWADAVDLIKGCHVGSVMQAHSLDVSLELKNGERLQAVEPQIDEVFDIVTAASGTCGDILLGTE
jgi:hypothetical protein